MLNKVIDVLTWFFIHTFVHIVSMSHFTAPGKLFVAQSNFGSLLQLKVFETSLFVISSLRRKNTGKPNPLNIVLSWGLKIGVNEKYIVFCKHNRFVLTIFRYSFRMYIWKNIYILIFIVLKQFWAFKSF